MERNDDMNMKEDRTYEMLALALDTNLFVVKLTINLIAKNTIQFFRGVQHSEMQ